MKNILIFLLLFIPGCTALATDIPFHLKHAMEIIEANFGDKVALKPATILKFGRSEQVSSSTYTTLSTAPSGILNETYISSNLINSISSSNAGDAQVVTVDGHKIVGTNFVFVRQNVTLNGQTAAALATPLARVSRAFNNNSVDFAGAIYFFETDTLTAGVPDTDTKVHLMIPSGTTNQTLCASTTIDHKEYLIITNAFGSINTKSGSPIADMEIQVRQFGKVFRTVAIATVSTAGATSVGFQFNPPVIVPKNSDLRLRALGSANNIDVSGWINGYIAKVKD